MKLIVGLGNPGPDYAGTRHNAGWMVVERLAQKHGLASGPPRSKFHSLCMEGDIAGQRCILLKPVTFMNRSGLAAGEAASFYKLANQDILIIVDETALPLGRLRLRADGTSGGHNGLKDIERALGGANYPRLRIGIGSPPPNIPRHDYVLGDFKPGELDQLMPAIDLAADVVECWIKEGIEKAMTKYNRTEQ